VFDYVDLGLGASVPLPVPESNGTWELSGGIHVWSPRDALTLFTDGDGFQPVCTFDFNIEYEWPV